MDRIKIAESKYLRNFYPRFYEEERLKTSERWPHEKPTKDEMARAGFVLLGGKNNDTVECVYCWTLIEKWLPSDDPLLEHRKFSPRCPVFGENPLQ